MSEEPKIKIVLVGESGVGKTNLIRVVNDESFEKEAISTISSSYIEKDIIVNNKKFCYSLWDTVGQETYRSLNEMYIKDAKIVLVVFALNDQKSYQETNFWINNAKRSLKKGKYLMALVGNKSDLVNEQEVTDEEVKKRAAELEIDFTLTSAAEDAVGFRVFLEDMIKKFIKTIGFELKIEKTFNLNEEKKKEEKNENIKNGKKKKKCCN